MAKPNVLILTGYGINCDWETEFAFREAGARAERVHINDIIQDRKRFFRHQILAVPGGFSFGDDLGSGKVLGNKIRTHLRDEVLEFVAGDRLVIGICNGFQVLVKSGLLPHPSPELKQEVTLTFNLSGKYEDRWVRLTRKSGKCVFTAGIEMISAPVAHGEGRFFAEDATLDALERQDQVVFQYASPAGGPARVRFPENPNGSVRDIAGICDATGRIFGMMPHPERHLFFTSHPHWVRTRDRLARAGEKIPEEGDGFRIFRNAVGYFT